MKALLIHHEDAGSGEISTKSLKRLMKSAGWKVRAVDRDAADAETIADAKADVVVIAGGDGTVAGILARLPDRTVPVAILPTGTANNIARSLGITGDLADIVAGWDLDRRIRFDIGSVEGPWGHRPFAEGVGFGAFADSLRLASPDAEGQARIRAGRDALRTALGDAAPLPLVIEVDGRRLPDNLLMAEILNIALTGPRLPLAQGADPGDGWLSISCLGKDDAEAMAKRLKSDRTDSLPVDQFQGREVVVRGGGVAMRIDDESCWLEPGSDVTIRLEGEPVHILAPSERPALSG